MTTPPPTSQGHVGKPRSFNARFNAALNRILTKLKVEEVPHIKRIIITVVGGTILIFGAALLFLPGPGALVILGGLAVLGTEYAWARRWLRKGKRMAKKAVTQTQKIFSSKDSTTRTPEDKAETTEQNKTTLVH